MHSNNISVFFTLDGYESPRYNPHIKRDVLPHINRLSDGSMDIVSRLVRTYFPETQFTLLLFYLKAQEDLYDVLMDDQRVARFIVLRANPNDAEIEDVEIESYSAHSYMGWGKWFYQKYRPGLELMRELLREARGPEPEEDWNPDDNDMGY